MRASSSATERLSRLSPKVMPLPVLGFGFRSSQSMTFSRFGASATETWSLRQALPMSLRHSDPAIGDPLFGEILRGCGFVDVERDLDECRRQRWDLQDQPVLPAARSQRVGWFASGQKSPCRAPPASRSLRPWVRDAIAIADLTVVHAATHFSVVDLARS